MATITTPRTLQVPIDWSLADIQNHLGGVPLERIRNFPSPGLATVEDVEELNVHQDRLCELIDGILVEKTAGFRDALIASLIATELVMFVSKHNLGIVLPASGTLQILPNQVRIPDACFISRQRFPKGGLPKEPIPLLIPDLAIEILSKDNSPGEMERKRQDYFQAGVRIVWSIDPPMRSAMVYTSADDQGTQHTESEPLSGGDVLPGFTLSLAEIFQQADSQAGR